jgi:hypothetical protein
MKIIITSNRKFILTVEVLPYTMYKPKKQTFRIKLAKRRGLSKEAGRMKVKKRTEHKVINHIIKPSKGLELWATEILFFKTKSFYYIERYNLLRK